MTTREKVLSALRKHKSFLVSTHVNPDPDALGSELSTAIFLRALGKEVHIVNEEPAPQRLAFLPRARWINGYARSRHPACDAAIILDCGELDRIGKVQKLISPGTPVINIDHHVTNDFFGDINLVEPKASSTAEVLYLLFKEAGHALTKDLAFNLYVGLMTDTGSFRFENTTARTHAICADLMRFNFSITDIYRKVYASIPYKDLKEFTKLISRFDVLYGGRVVCVELSRAILAKFSKQFDLRDTIFQFLRAMHGVDVFVIFTEDGAKKTRINLRSSSKFDVAKLASDFSGGGHKRASGCSIDKGMKAARNIFLGRIGKLLRA
ncbi:MAG TPA: hypothetical protein DE315_08045 [Candidatus Omnitrophica bacterium]|nr:MAG: hypothetical protein A2Y05_05095 [Omnitrophica WOR_2 bacterium GWA2_53_43]HBO97129.1 hypothetical protein [Candidatus Omnitrophota bacterium]HCI45462.1 hypothetical protein [Candidatus Omnitrophota bacterium]